MNTKANYTCPCCQYRGRLTQDIFSLICSIVADAYGLSAHDVEWAGHAENRRAMEARDVAVYFVRNFSAAMNKEINKFFHWADHSSNATTRYLTTVSAYEKDGYFARKVDEIEEKLVGEFRKKFSSDAICA